MRWISSMNSTSPGVRLDSSAARSPACWIAGPLDMRSGRPLSCATIIASVVLPSPGGPASRMWSGVRFWIARGLQQQLELPADLLLPDELGERARAQRALEGELRLVDSGSGRRRVDHRRVVAPCAPGRARASASRSSAGTDRASASPRSAATSSTASGAARSRQPRPTSAGRPRAATSARRASRRRRDARRARRACRPAARR